MTCNHLIKKVEADTLSNRSNSPICTALRFVGSINYALSSSRLPRKVRERNRRYYLRFSSLAYLFSPFYFYGITFKPLQPSLQVPTILQVHHETLLNRSTTTTPTSNMLALCNYVVSWPLANSMWDKYIEEEDGLMNCSVLHYNFENYM